MEKTVGAEGGAMMTPRRGRVGAELRSKTVYFGVFLEFVFWNFLGFLVFDSFRNFRNDQDFPIDKLKYRSAWMANALKRNFRLWFTFHAGRDGGCQVL